MQRIFRPRRLALVVVACLLVASLGGALVARGRGTVISVSFPMLRSADARAAGCVPQATAQVTDAAGGAVERMDVHVAGLPPNTKFTFFVIQVPNAPFGVSWYLGDIKTGADGAGDQTFVGRFNRRTFIVAPGVAPAFVLHTETPFPDASSNPATNPVHMFHLGLWFNSPTDAARAGCGNAVTPFNGVHQAGAQVLSTRQFGNKNGPLRHGPDR
jgi:hypothetical protein